MLIQQCKPSTRFGLFTNSIELPLIFLAPTKKPPNGGIFVSGFASGLTSGSCPRRSAMPAAVQIAPDDLSNLLSVLIFLAPTKKPPNGGIFVSGACGRIRTSDRLVRSQVLYPAELRTRKTLKSDCMPISLIENGGEGGIRTLDTATNCMVP